MSVVTVLVLTVFVLPRFTVFFKSLNAKLPLITIMMMDASSFVLHWWYVEAAVVIISSWALYRHAAFTRRSCTT